jgi:uncharacterized membrane protein (DUF2068 family)
LVPASYARCTPISLMWWQGGPPRSTSIVTSIALSKLLSLDAYQLRKVSAGIFSYAALLLTEGTGLLLRQRWAEYFTIIVTASFIPLELYELAKRITFARLIVVGINVAVVWYLASRLRPRRQEHRR